jgi:hypothetical protein
MVYLLACLALATRASAFVVVSPTHTHMHTMNRVQAPFVVSVEESPSSSFRLSAMTSSLNEKVMEKLPSKPVVDAVIESKTESIVASDVATRAGVSISQARRDLTTLASLSQGDISVSSDGELIYEFPKDLNGVLSSNSAKYKAKQTFEKAWPSIFWGLRVSFGVALVASVALVFSAIVVLQSEGGQSEERRRDDRRGGGMGLGGMWGPSPFDFFYYRPYGSYGYYGQSTDGVVKDPEDMGFLESVFSYVFGDGNPNAGLEEKRLSLAAQMIRNNKGAVTAEQLAPYCDAPDVSDNDLSTSGSSGSYVDESFVLPIVSQLDGEPQVTEDGDIIYVFPDLQISASDFAVLPQASESAMVLKRAGLDPNASSRDIQNLLRRNGISSAGARDKADLLELVEAALGPMTAEDKAEAALLDPSLLQEREYTFSLASGFNKFAAGGLGVANLVGVLYLGNLFNQYNLMYGARLPSFLGVAQTLYPALVVYAILFNTIPLARNFWISQQNAKIQGRNTARRRWKGIASSGGKKVLRKLKAASKFATGRKTIKGDDTLYDTKQSSGSLQAKKEQFDLDEFDKLLNDEQNTFQ